MEEREPARWSADPREDDVSELLAGLRAARSAGPSPEQLARMRAAVALPLVASGGGKLALRLLTGGLLLAIAGAYFLTTRTVERSSAARRSTALDAAPSVRTPAPAPASVVVAPSPAEPEPAVIVPHKRVAGAPKPPLARDHVAMPAVDAELALLRPARAHTRSSPARALELVARHEREHAHGVLIEEREVIAIEALVESDRLAEAAQRARRFFEEHPSSAHVRRVRALLREAGPGGSTQE